MRGKLEGGLSDASFMRITPAHAGKTARHPADDESGPDHPRACGENDDEEDDEELHLGSPPRMRGKHP